MVPGRATIWLVLKIIGLLKRLIQTKRITPRHEHLREFPPELVEVVISHLDTKDDRQTLLRCALVCQCWLVQARALTFSKLHVRGEYSRVFKLIELLRAKDLCTFIPAIREVSLVDTEFSQNVLILILSQLVKSQVTPACLRIESQSPVRPLPAASRFCQLTELHITTGHGYAFECKLFHIASFIGAFQVLESLSITAWKVSIFDPCDAGAGYLYQLSPRLRHFAFNAPIQHDASNVNFPYLILQKYPRLHTLSLTHLGHNPAVLFDYFKEQGRHLTTLCISGSFGESAIQQVHALQAALPIISLQSSTPPSYPLPALHTLKVTSGIEESQEAEVASRLLGSWVLAVATHSTLLTDLLLTDFALDASARHIMESQLGFTASDGYHRYCRVVS